MTFLLSRFVKYFHIFFPLSHLIQSANEISRSVQSISIRKAYAEAAVARLTRMLLRNI